MGRILVQSLFPTHARARRWVHAFLVLLTLLTSLASGGFPVARAATAAATVDPDAGDGYVLWSTVWYGQGDLTDVFFLDSQHGWVTATSGRVFRTINGGHSWHMAQWRPDPWAHRPRSEGPILRGVAFTTPLRGWAVGDGGLILRTFDGGDTWHEQASHISSPLNAIAFAADGVHGWIVGNNGVILHTGDGGETWTRQRPGVGVHLYGLHIHDAQHVWVVGQNGYILYTDDGGAHWTTQRSGGQYLQDILFLPDGETGWAVGNVGTVWTTTDHGQTWTAEDAGTSQNLLGVTRDPAGNLWVSGSYGTLGRRTPDGTWSFWNVGINRRFEAIVYTDRFWMAGDIMTLYTATSPDGPWYNPLGGNITTLGGIALPDGVHGWAVGRRANVPSEKAGVILRTEDGGWSWYAQEYSASPGYFNRVAAVDANTAWVVGEHGGQILHTEDGGATWVRQAGGTSREVTDVACADAQRCWATVDTPPNTDPLILVTDDGGAHWRVQSLGSKFVRQLPAISVNVTPDGRGMIYNLYGEHLITRDYFLTTQRSIFSAAAHGQWDVDLYDGDLMFSSGMHGQIVRMREGEYVPLKADADKRRCEARAGLTYCNFKGGGGSDMWEWFGVGIINPHHVIGVGGKCSSYRNVGGVYECVAFSGGMFGYTSDPGTIGTWTVYDDPDDFSQYGRVGTPGRLRDLWVWRSDATRDHVSAPGPRWDALAVGDGGYILGYRGLPHHLFAYPIDPQPSVDGRLSEWAETPGLDVSGENADRVGIARPDSDADLSAHLRARRSGNILYLGIRVRDDHIQVDDHRARMDDGVRVALDGRHDAVSGGLDDLVIWVNAAGEYQVETGFSSALIAVGVQPTDDGYEVELAISASSLGLGLDGDPTWGITYEVWDDDDGGPPDHILGSDGPGAWGSHPDMATLTILGPEISLQRYMNRWSWTQHTHIRSWSGGNDWRAYNFGYYGTLDMTARGVYEMLLQFNVDILPPSMVIQQAEVRLFTAEKYGSGTLPVQLHRALRSWNFEEATWYQADRREFWAQPGAQPGVDYAATPEWTTTVVGPNGWYTWDVTQLVRDWVSGRQANYGMLLRSNAERGPEFRFYPSNAHPYYRARSPRLRIRYQIPWPGATPPPT
ncbi:MAG: DNRLRE domain-containing protein, partial [Chloroflexi bacterium]|nr:DNRLRE domain-containing protein [Chloroflexota bacterium]